MSQPCSIHSPAVGTLEITLFVRPSIGQGGVIWFNQFDLFAHQRRWRSVQPRSSLFQYCLDNGVKLKPFYSSEAIFFFYSSSFASLINIQGGLSSARCTADYNPALIFFLGFERCKTGNSCRKRPPHMSLKRLRGGNQASNTTIKVMLTIEQAILTL